MIRSVIGRMIPENIKSVLEYYRYPQLLNGFDGPFNGQCGRQQLFIDVCRSAHFSHIIETGAFRGTTTEYFVRETGLPIYSVESEARYYHYAKYRLRSFSRVHLYFGDSRPFLKDVATHLGRDGSRPFVYLDAHWHSDLPLREEIGIVLNSFDEYVIMIDDFRVPYDSGYGFDQYSEVETLSLEYVARAIEGHRCRIAYPELPSSRESGRRRGCILIFPDKMESRLESAPSLRLFSPDESPSSFVQSQVNS
jgi:hypothetical protein